MLIAEVMLMNGMKELQYSMDFIPTKKELRIVEEAKPFTMTSGQRNTQTVRAVRELDANNIPGDIVECGVWKGGHIISAWLANAKTKRNFWLFDTFEGMTLPTVHDHKITTDGDVKYAKHSKKAKHGFDQWCRAEIGEVSTNVFNYIPPHQCNFIKGPVEETLLDDTNLPNTIALLRLDTDWYESTLQEILTLWPRLSVGGIMVLDDYNSWRGSSKAFHEVFGNTQEIHTIDATAVYIRKTQA